MRKATYSTRKTVYCPNATTMGYATRKAKFGSWVTIEETNTDGSKGESYGRVYGVITDCDNDGVNCVGNLAVLTVGSNHRHCFPRWIDPSDIIECHDEPPVKLMAWMMGDEFPKDPKLIESMAEYGSLSESYIDNIKSA